MKLKNLTHALVLGALVLAGAQPALAVSPEVDSFSGRSYSELSAAWWQWAFSIPASNHPHTSQGAIDCGVNQQGPVWFLAGGPSGTVATRSCEIPRQKALFFPVLNGSWVNEPHENLTVAEKRDLLDGLLSDTRPGFLADLGFPGTRAGRLEATLDGQPVSYETPIVRVQSPAFLVNTGGDPIYGSPNVTDPESISDGFWVLLPPLSPGQHVLNFEGHFCVFDSQEDHPFFPVVDITYHLTVR